MKELSIGRRRTVRREYDGYDRVVRIWHAAARQTAFGEGTASFPGTTVNGMPLALQERKP